MPNSTSRNWNYFNQMEMDRRHREAERGRRLNAVRRSPKPAAEGYQQCNYCPALVKPANMIKHITRVHKSAPIENYKVTRRPLRESGAKQEMLREIKIVRASVNCSEISKWIPRSSLAKYLMFLARREGLDVKTVHDQIPAQIAQKILARFDG